MAYWVYKCNAKESPQKVVFGDWDYFFASAVEREWGSTEWATGIDQLGNGDFVIAYQTDRNELVGLAQVVRVENRGNYFDAVLKPIEEIRVKVRPLKKIDERIAAIPAFQSGPKKTIYDISASDAKYLLRQARTSISR